MQAPPQPADAADDARPDSGSRSPLRRSRNGPGDGRVALDKFPGVVFQLLRSIDGSWSFPFAGQELPRLFLTTAGALAEDAASAAAHIPEDDLTRLKLGLAESMESGRTLKARFRVKPPEFAERWLEVTAAPELAFSGGTVWNGFVADVSSDHRANRDLRQLHRRWTLAARAAGIGVVEYDRASGILSLDAIACSHHDIEAEQSLVPLAQWLECVAPADRLVAHTAFESEPVEGFSDCLLLRLVGPEGGAGRTLEFRFQAVADEQRLVGTCRDVTQQQELEALRSDKLAAEKASRSKSEFMSRVSHELRTPLNGILGFVQLMTQDRQNPLPPVHLRRLDVLQQSGARLLGLIDQLLDVSRMEEGRLPLRPRPLDAAPFIDQCVAAVYPLARSRGVQVSVEVVPGAAPLQADAQALEQVLANLLSNAIKYNRQNGRVRVRLSTDEVARLVVDDTGVGMSEAQLGMLFQPFNRLGAERTGVAGSGLGLVITRKLVHAMGGTLEVQSLVGRGSRFEVCLPLAEGRPVAEPVAASPAGGFASEWGADLPHVVLYIEDDEVNTLLMEQVFLSQPAWHLVTARTGAEGLQRAIERQPSAVLLDLHLPDTSGFEVLRQMRADPRTRHIPCIAVSADALSAQIDEALAAGFTDYWTKPLDLAAVVTGLKAVFRGETAPVRGASSG